MTVPNLTPGSPAQMLGEAIRYLKALPRDAKQRADVFEVFAKQIENYTKGSWGAVRGTGADGSEIFSGRQGEALVVRSDGRLFRGSIRNGINITANGLQPDYNKLKILD